MRDFHAATTMVLVSALLLPVDGFCLSEAERLAGYDGDIRDWQVTVGVGTGAFHGGAYGVGLEAGYKDIGVFASLGKDLAIQHSAFTDGRYDEATAKIPAGELPEMDMVWRLGVKGYLGGEELKFRPYLAGMVGPLMAYKINFNGRLLAGTYTSFGLAAGCDWDPGVRRGIVLTLGVSAFALTHTIPEADQGPVSLTNKGELPFINADLVAGLNYRF